MDSVLEHILESGIDSVLESVLESVVEVAKSSRLALSSVGFTAFLTDFLGRPLPLLTAAFPFVEALLAPATPIDPLRFTVVPTWSTPADHTAPAARVAAPAAVILRQNSRTASLRPWLSISNCISRIFSLAVGK